MSSSHKEMEKEEEKEEEEEVEEAEEEEVTTLSVVCPEGVGPGDTLYISTEDGEELEIV
eukprot:SAG22_NODE_13887_length_392_cov_0.518771_1_plen_58_part_10